MYRAAKPCVLVMLILIFILDHTQAQSIYFEEGQNAGIVGFGYSDVDEINVVSTGIGIGLNGRTDISLSVGGGWKKDYDTQSSSLSTSFSQIFMKSSKQIPVGTYGSVSFSSANDLNRNDVSSAGFGIGGYTYQNLGISSRLYQALEISYVNVKGGSVDKVAFGAFLAFAVQTKKGGKVIFSIGFSRFNNVSAVSFGVGFLRLIENKSDE